VAPSNEWLGDPGHRTALKDASLYRGSFDGGDPTTIHYDFNRTREYAEVQTALSGHGAADYDAGVITVSAIATVAYGLTDDYLAYRVSAMLTPLSDFTKKLGDGVVFLTREDGTIRRGAKGAEVAEWFKREADKKSSRVIRHVTLAGKSRRLADERVERLERRALAAAPDAAADVQQVRREYDESISHLVQRELGTGE
jgi:hypothetical protein